MLRNRDVVIDLLKLVGNTIRDATDTRTYRITIIIEDKIDDNNGIVVEHIVINKELSTLQIKTLTKEIRALLNKK